jgi:hypothetical protein
MVQKGMGGMNETINERLEPLRTLIDHMVPDGLNAGVDSVRITVHDKPGQGGACHEYVMSYMDRNGNRRFQGISFQNGPMLEFGVNGITQEALLAIVIDRLRGFQSGPFSCRENAIALTKCEEALMWLQKRTMDRVRRGVEGRNRR